MTNNVLDFVKRAQTATEQTAQRVERETAIERFRDECTARRERTQDIPMPDVVRRLVIGNKLDDGRFLTLRAVRAWFTHSTPCLILGGTTGRGKSVAGIDAVAAHGGVFIEAHDLMRLWNAKYGADVQARVKLFTTPCLVIDDVGTELAADRAVMSAALVALLNKRSSTRTRTLVTFNGDKKFFRELYTDERLHSRLAQLGAFVVDVGPDLRRTPPA